MSWITYATPHSLPYWYLRVLGRNHMGWVTYNYGFVVHYDFGSLRLFRSASAPGQAWRRKIGEVVD
jgi:hypothetical protein